MENLKRVKVPPYTHTDTLGSDIKDDWPYFAIVVQGERKSDGYRGLSQFYTRPFSTADCGTFLYRKMEKWTWRI